MKFKFITRSDPYYKDARMLRWEALEKPMGIPPEVVLSPEDKTSIQLVALEKDHIVGCVLCHPQSEKEGKVFDFVLTKEGRGFGRQMMSKLEELLQRKGLSYLYVIAKEDLCDMYSHLGYSPEGESFEEYGVLYQKMGKYFLPAS
ncbi:MAG: GNAT family N-acetyltransferase [Chlamydiota bacterium]